MEGRVEDDIMAEQERIKEEEARGGRDEDWKQGLDEGRKTNFLISACEASVGTFNVS